MISSGVGGPKLKRTKAITVAPTADVIDGITTVGFRIRERGSFCIDFSIGALPSWLEGKLSQKLSVRCVERFTKYDFVFTCLVEIAY
jgi:hypothetical protein